MTKMRFTDPIAEASWVHQLGMQEWRAGRIDEALKHFEKALGLKRKIANTSSEASTLHMVGIIYAQKEDWDNATRYLLWSLKIDAEDRHYDGVAISLHDIAVMCGKRGDIVAKALDELANLILGYKRGEAELNRETAMRLLENAPVDLKEGIQEAVQILMRW